MVLMIVSICNCDGVGSRTFPRILKDIVIEHGIKVMGLLETRISGSRANNEVRRLGFHDWLRVEASGFVGGIWILWKSWETDFEYIFLSTQLVHCRLTDKNSGA